MMVANMAVPTLSSTARVRFGRKVTGRAGVAGWAADSLMVRWAFWGGVREDGAGVVRRTGGGGAGRGPGADPCRPDPS
ncbi:hypothetical protein Slala02_73630 [Streptomyces lavendulae subsp. lavendulae]|nr:hypothetical protein Slala01_72860 [Streptomyces lavendulae subsp. lavendulae]GLX31544.1 hypothetical protein Slala02_73630 [Streptomyces lavendulae subsp. lavendulae]